METQEGDQRTKRTLLEDRRGVCLKSGWGFRGPGEQDGSCLAHCLSWYHGRTMLIKSFSLIQPECKLGRNEDKLGLKAANTFNPMLLILQPNKVTLLREITRPKPWAQLLNSIKNETLA